MWLMIDVKNRIETEIQVFIWIEDVDDETKKKCLLLDTYRT